MKLIPILIMMLMMCSISSYALVCGKMDFVEYDPMFTSHKSWSCEFALGGATGKIIGSMSKSELSDSQTGAEASHDFEITFTPKSQSCSYRIEAKGDKVITPNVYHINTEVFELGRTMDEDILRQKRNLCYQRSDSSRYARPITIDRPWPGMNYLLCVYVIDEGGEYSLFQAPSNYFEAEMTVTSLKEGTTATGIITNDPNIDTGFGDTDLNMVGKTVIFKEQYTNKIVARGEWLGNLQTTDSCPDPRTHNDVIALKKGNRYTFVNQHAYNNYKDAIISTFFEKRFEYEPWKEIEEITQKIKSDWEVSTTNWRKDILLDPTKRKTVKSTNFKVSSPTAVEGDILNLIIPTPLQVIIPKISLRTDAEWIGLIEPKGNPSIIDINPKPVKIQRGIGSVVRIDIKNEANTFAGFNIKLIGCRYTVISDIGTIPMLPNEVKTIDIPVFSNAPLDITDSCSIRVEDSKDPSVYDEMSLSFDHTLGEVACEPYGIKRCTIDKSALEKCGLGGKWSKDVCDYGCANLPEPHCMTLEEYCSINPSAPICSIKCKSCWGWLKGKIFSKARCMPQPVFEYKIFGLITVARMSQSKFCPYFFLGILTFFGMIAYLIAMNWEKILSLYGGLRK